MKQGKRYTVYGWSKENPRKVLNVWVDQITLDHVIGHVRDTHGIVTTCTWSREMANSWRWLEMKEGD